MRYDFHSIPERRGTSSLKWDFGERFAGRAGLLPLWVADMDFKVPPEIMEALQARVSHGVFGYTLEPESYFEAAAGWFSRRHGWSVPRDWMLASPGVIPALVAALLALSEPGDGVVIQPPVYYPFALRILANGRRVVENPLRLAGTRWEMDLDGLASVVDERTRLLVLCSPHNPVARVWRREELVALVAFCARRGITIVSDEIHGDLAMQGYRHLPVATLGPEAARITVTLAAATKTFNLAGLGGSLTIVADPLARRRVESVQRALFAGTASAPAIAAFEAAWRHGDAWLDELLAYIGGNLSFLEGFLATRIPGVASFPLEGTYLAWLDMRGLAIPDDEVKDRLQRVGGVWLDEGRMFGRGGEGFQRLNLACPRAILSDAADRMARALATGAAP